MTHYGRSLLCRGSKLDTFLTVTHPQRYFLPYCLALLGVLGGVNAVAQEFDLKYFDYAGSGRQALFEVQALPAGEVLMYGHHFASQLETERAGVILTVNEWGDQAGPAHHISDLPAQIKDVYLAPDGSQTLLTSYQAPNSLVRSYGIIRRDAAFDVQSSRSWVGTMQAVAGDGTGNLYVVGSSRASLGAITKIGSNGEPIFARKLVPETVRPASLLDVQVLRNGDLLALGFITTTVGGTPQKEITLLRFTADGAIVWSKKISRDRFFGADGLIMELRQPSRFHLDAEENIHLITFLGAGGNQWRTHLLKLDPDGEVIHSTAYRTDDQFAGQGAIHVSEEGLVTAAFASITSPSAHSLTVLRIDAEGNPLQAIRKDGEQYDVSGITWNADPGAFFISGVTRDCQDGERVNYLARLDEALFFATPECPGDPVSYLAEEVPVAILAHPVAFEELVSEGSSPPTLEEFTVRQRSVGCTVFEPVELPPYIVGCGTVPGRYSLVDSIRTLDDGANLRSVRVRITGGPLGASLRYEGAPYPAVTSTNAQEITYREPDRYAVRNLQFFLDRLSLVPPAGLDFAGTYAIEFAVEGNCGERFTRSVTVTVLRPTAAPELAEGGTLTLCPGAPLVLRARSPIPANFTWPDGSTADTLLVDQPGNYTVAADNGCGADATTFTVVQPTAPLPPGADTTLYVCPGGSVTYRLPDHQALPQVQWNDGRTDPQRTWESDELGTYTLSLRTDCEAVSYGITIAPSSDVSAAASDRTFNLCAPGDTVWLSLPQLAGVTSSWTDGFADVARPVIAAADFEIRMDNGCTDAAATYSVRPAPVSTLTDETINELLCYGDSVRFRPDPRPGLTTYLPDDSLRTEFWVRAGSSLSLVRTDGCAEATLTFNALAEDCCRVYLPTAFSPNGDGVNDTYAPQPARGSCALYANPELRVYDRWGSLVHAGSEAWDGRVRGELAAAGTYLVRHTYFNGRETVERVVEVVLLQ
ncbi:hypothetical protein A3850_019065 [Lewinella sp. 4G2]|nr:hypothetical protein A3850_019065 [Lewinella sp. 4G2]